MHAETFTVQNNNDLMILNMHFRYCIKNFSISEAFTVTYYSGWALLSVSSNELSPYLHMYSIVTHAVIL